MKSQTTVMRVIRTGLVCLISGLSALCGPLVSADITFEARGEEGRGERFSLDVRDEPIAKVMDKLAERFDFEVDGYPEHWSDEPMSFSATGNLERVLRSLLKDTSHVFEYHTDTKTKTTRIAGLKLLNEGVDGFVTTTTKSSSNSAPNSPRPPAVAGSIGNERTSTEALASPRAGSTNNFSNGSAESTNAIDGSEGNRSATRTASAPVSGLSRSLETRARQSSSATAAANSTASNSAASPATSQGNPAANISDADMQALTQRALQDVQGLAEALRKAEGK